METQARWNDQQIEQIIGVLLRVGVEYVGGVGVRSGRLLTLRRTMQCASVTSSFTEKLRR